MAILSDPTIIGQFNLERIRAILPEIERQAKTKKDFIVPSAKLKSAPDGRLSLPADVQSFKLADSGNTYLTWEEAEKAAAPGEKIIPQTGGGDLPLSRTAERQLCQRLGVPLDFLDRLRREGQGEVAADIATLRLRLPRKGEDPDGAETRTDRFMVRTLDGKVRAVLSPSYRIIDNVDLFYCVAQKCAAAGAEIWQMRLTENSFQMLAVAKGISGNVTTDRTFNPGDGWESRWANLGGDTQFAALSIENSETGGGSASVAPAVMTRVCANFNVWAKTMRAVHVGRRRAEDGLIESAEIEAAESRLIWMKIQQAIDTVFNVDRFADYIDTLNAATQRNIPRDNATKTVENVAMKFEIAEADKGAILQALMESRDYSQYGLMQAITVTAHEKDAAGESEAASDLEFVGGSVAHLGATEFKELVG
jgi:hypothetical protein